jgi:hypothetical protein
MYLVSSGPRCVFALGYGCVLVGELRQLHCQRTPWCLLVAGAIFRKAGGWHPTRLGVSPLSLT